MLGRRRAHRPSPVQGFARFSTVSCLFAGACSVGCDPCGTQAGRRHAVGCGSGVAVARAGAHVYVGLAVAVDPQADGTSQSIPTTVDVPAALGTSHMDILVEVLAAQLQALYDAAERVPRWRAWWDRVSGRAEGRTDLPGGPELWRGGHCHVVHVDGPWGAGKATALRMLAERLGGSSRPKEDRWLVFDFDAPAHQRIEPRWWALLNTVHRSAIRKLWPISRRRTLALRVSAAWWSLREGTAAFIVPLAGVAGIYVLWKSGAFERGWKGIGETAQAIAAVLALGATLWGATRALNRRLQAASLGAARQLERTEARAALVRRRFASLMHMLRQPVAILIWDLDRCDPGFTVELVDGIPTLWPDVPVAYVVAADGAYVRESYLEVYARSPRERREHDPSLAWRVYDAAVHQIVHLPTPRVDPILSEAPGDRAKADALFESLVPPDQILARLQSAEQDGNIGAAALRRAALLRLGSAESRSALQHRLFIATPLLEPSPRVIKTFVQRYLDALDTIIVEGRHVGADAELLTKLALWTVLRVRWPPLAEFLAAHPDAVPDAVSAATQRKPRSGASWRPELTRLISDEDVGSVILGSGTGVALDADTVALLAGQR